MKSVELFFQTATMFRDMAAGRYPDFVLRSQLGSEVPVFYFHRIDPIEFERMLSLIVTNRYVTLCADELAAVLSGSRPRPARALVLTIDDGREDVYTVAYPMLAATGNRAVAFIIPSRLNTPGMLNSEQIREMHASGTIDFQSHSLSHSRIPISPRVVRFQSYVGTAANPWDVPAVTPDEDSCCKSTPPGTPQFESASRMSDRRRFIPNSNVIAACREFAASRRAQSLGQRAWSRQLRMLLSTSTPSRAQPGTYETEEEQHAAIRTQLIDSKQAIEGHIPGKTVHHFAFPWSEVGEITYRLLPSSGYTSSYHGLLPTPDVQGPTHEPRIRRLSGDFVLRLPGSGRLPLARVLAGKMKRRVNAPSHE
jgi:hypothetical protein